MKSRNQLVEKYAKEAAEEHREAEERPDNKLTLTRIIENSMYRLLSDTDNFDFERGSELLRSLQGRMVKK